MRYSVYASDERGVREVPDEEPHVNSDPAEPRSDPSTSTSDAGAGAVPPESDSAAFARCASCAHAGELDRSAGTLLCSKHDMRINAEADEIPDECTEFSARDAGT